MNFVSVGDAAHRKMRKTYGFKRLAALFGNIFCCKYNTISSKFTTNRELRSKIYYTTFQRKQKKRIHLYESTRNVQKMFNISIIEQILKKLSVVHSWKQQLLLNSRSTSNFSHFFVVPEMLMDFSVSLVQVCEVCTCIECIENPKQFDIRQNNILLED